MESRVATAAIATSQGRGRASANKQGRRSPAVKQQGHWKALWVLARNDEQLVVFSTGRRCTVAASATSCAQAPDLIMAFMQQLPRGIQKRKCGRLCAHHKSDMFRAG